MSDVPQDTDPVPARLPASAQRWECEGCADVFGGSASASLHEAQTGHKTKRTSEPSADLNELERLARANGYWHHIAPWASTLAALRAEVERKDGLLRRALGVLVDGIECTTPVHVHAREERQLIQDLNAALAPLPERPEPT